MNEYQWEEYEEMMALMEFIAEVGMYQFKNPQT